MENKRDLLVIGASSDIGMSIMKRIEGQYHRIYAQYAHMNPGLQQLKEELGDKLVLIQEIFNSNSAGKEVVEFLNKMDVYPQDILHLAAPPIELKKFSRIKWKDYEENINVCLASAVNVLSPVLSGLFKRKKAGKVIIMLTSYTVNIPPAYMSQYITIKYAMLGLVKALSAEYADKGITVNAISPGMMETKFLQNIFDHAIEENAQKSPLGRNLKTDDVIPAFEFLLSDNTNCITGQNIIVSGGK